MVKNKTLFEVREVIIMKNYVKVLRFFFLEFSPIDRLSRE